ncbi:3-oxoacyl-ACP synthase III family protein [Alteromonas sp. a30]|uniref:3-oxoacyl-ACP synthase III family protein n=1 Tax=Alteromonas sp. a30 TaxID=2730917 RepID=UPI0022807CC6|nr:ketoacyl-ACP synthase III [Alteromonas sp. a30]MCY7297225.1 ketoacyl-ACP synthase III [Alteromonas sp. a30]
MKPYLAKSADDFVIAGTGYCVGQQKLNNAELIESFGIRIKESFINKNIGIETRYFLSPEETTSDLATEAAHQALAQANLSANQLDRLIVATSTPDHSTPSTACIVQHKLGASGFPASDIVAACTGFLYGLDQALRCLATGDDYVLLVGVDCRSRTLNMQDKRTAFLYGDGAGAVVLKRQPADVRDAPHKRGFVDCFVQAEGEGFDAVIVPAGGAAKPCTPENVSAMQHKLSMPSGERVARNAMRAFKETTFDLLARNRLSLADIDLFIFHQPNLRLLEKVSHELDVDPDKMLINFNKFGNTVAGSVPIALAEAVSQNRIQAGSKVLFCAVGGGYTKGAALYLG